MCQHFEDLYTSVRPGFSKWVMQAVTKPGMDKKYLFKVQNWLMDFNVRIESL